MSTGRDEKTFRILHCLRAPVGGLFRHVCDLAKAQSDAGHSVGVLCADEPNDPMTLERISDLEKSCALGVSRIGLGRMPGVSDLKALIATSEKVKELRPSILHGHGAKGGLLARFATSSEPVARVYTPHGGSVHYQPRSVAGAVFGFAERVMMARTDGLIFESDFARSVFAKRFGPLPDNTRVVHNGLSPNEFAAVTNTSDQADFLFLGEIRELKGIYTLLEAVTRIAASRKITLNIAGDGPDMDAFRAAIQSRGLTGSINLMGMTPAREAFAGAQAVLLPSHRDSFPYVALEVAAAGKPLIATSTGGVPEIFGPFADRLLEPGNVDALACEMTRFLNHPFEFSQDAISLREHVKTYFSTAGMADGISQVYAVANKNVLSADVTRNEFNPRTSLDAAE
jgi:glycosyltransferase involved in cell wall biosynthesis